MLLFRKYLRTYQMNDPKEKVKINNREGILSEVSGRIFQRMNSPPFCATAFLP